MPSFTLYSDTGGLDDLWAKSRVFSAVWATLAAQQHATIEAVNILSYMLALAAGSASPVQAGASSELNKDLAAPIWTALFVYATSSDSTRRAPGVARSAPREQLAVVGLDRRYSQHRINIDRAYARAKAGFRPVYRYYAVGVAPDLCPSR
jgi:hypothetical protein